LRAQQSEVEQLKIIKSRLYKSRLDKNSVGKTPLPEVFHMLHGHPERKRVKSKNNMLLPALFTLAFSWNKTYNIIKSRLYKSRLDK